MDAKLKPGPRNCLTDIAGLKVGNVASGKLKSGVTVVLCDQPVVASGSTMGGGPGTRDIQLLEPENSVESVDSIVLSGGSAFGLDAASGVQAYLRESGRGFKVGPVKIPIVPGAILFDLINGGDKDWGRYPPYRELAYEAAKDAQANFEIGTQGAGYGAMVAGLKGGLGTASLRLANGVTIAALVAVNAIGNPIVGHSGHFWAAPFEIGDEFGGLGFPHPLPDDASDLRIKFRELANPVAKIGRASCRERV